MTRILLFLRQPERGSIQLDGVARTADVTVNVASSIAEAAPFLAEAEVLVTLAPHLGADAHAIIAAMPRLRWVQLITTGTDDMAGLLAGSGIALTSARGLHGAQMSEAAIAAMLALARGQAQLFRNQQAGEWRRFAATLLTGRTVGILGLGAIADALAPRCRALGMRVVGITATPRPLPAFDEVRARHDIERAVSGLDHLVLLAPYSPATHRLIDARALRAMRRGAFLTNLARGGILDEAALVAALDDGHIAGAALDVFEQEPLPANSPLWNHPRIIVTPHVGGLHDRYAEDIEALVAENLRRFLADGPSALVNTVPVAEPLRHAAQ